VVARILPHREATDFSEVHLHRHLRHGQGNPSAMIDAALNGVKDTVARILEELLLVAWRSPQEVEESIHHCMEML
jgi:hypothetical protein